MVYVNTFIVCGIISMIGQIIYDNTKLTAGHITSLFVVIGVILDFANLYDRIIQYSLIGASLPITSFGHALIHASMQKASEIGWLGVFTGIFNNTAVGIGSAILFGFLGALIFKSHD